MQECSNTYALLTNVIIPMPCSVNYMKKCRSIQGACIAWFSNLSSFAESQVAVVIPLVINMFFYSLSGVYSCVSL